MSYKERTGTRDLTESGWHRPDSLSRFMSETDAESCSRIDIDCVWYDCKTYEPIALTETAWDDGMQDEKCASVTRNLAKTCQPLMHVFLVLYKPSVHMKNPANPELQDIESFRIKQLWPYSWYEFRTYSPWERAEFILNFHRHYAHYRDIHALVVECKEVLRKKYDPPGPYWEHWVHNQYENIDNTDYYRMTEDQLKCKVATITDWLNKWKATLI